MNERKTYKIEEITEKVGMGPFGSSIKVDTFVVDGIPVISGTHLKGMRLEDKDFNFISIEHADKLKNANVKRGDVIFTHAGNIGAVAFIPENSRYERYILSQRQFYLRCNKEKLLPEYITYYFKSPLGQKQLLANTSSVGVPSIAQPVTYLRSIEVEIPFIKEQESVVNILDALENKIELNLQMNQTLEAMAQAIFKEWFVDFNFPGFDGELVDGLPKGWRKGKFEELIEFTNGYAFKSSELLNIYEDDCYFVFKMGNIKKGGGLKHDGTKSFFKKVNSKNLNKYILKRGDLLMCMTDMKDNVALLGHTALMNEDDRYIVNQRVGLLRPKNDISIDFPYLYILTNFPEFIVELRSRANRGVQVNLSTSEIKNIQVLIPPKNINEFFDYSIKPVFKKLFLNIEQIQTLTQTRDNLLPKLMSGKIKINE